MNDLYLTSKTNPKIKELKTLMTSSRDRKKSALFVTEGVRLCVDAVKSGCEIVNAFCTEQCMEKNAEAVETVKNACGEFYIASADVMKSVSDTVTPQGLICTVRMTERDFEIHQGGKYIALDTIQNPDNLGAVSRTAEALGLDGLIIGGGCDIYNPKALRASMGALFRLPVKLADNLADFIAECNDKGIKTYATVPDRTAISITDVDFKNGAISVIGNEGNGVSKNVIDKCHGCVTIKMSGRAESLNAASAASIIMWEMVK